VPTAEFSFHDAEFVHSSRFKSERQRQRELQGAWAPNRVLDAAQATRRGNPWRTFEIREEGNVVVRSVEIGMVENIECIGFELQLEALLDQELLGHAHVEAHLEWALKTVPARRSKQGFIEIGPATVGNGNAVGPVTPNGPLNPAPALGDK